MHTVYLSLGSNLGDKERNIVQAIVKINEKIGAVVRQSSLLITEPWGFESDNAFVNCAVCCKTTLTPRRLLNATQRIEREMGRTQKSLVIKDGTPRVEYHDRIIDIDILLYDDVTIDTPTLKIPHPLMQERDFVMIPLREIWES
ncbi:MAG: 2-amino-4-hydroxy-6-hydroxymethyldihydropteridine diphosphokinase [Prevotella sp.]|nr:2-amino-4-hydroxy-6-hydroxymethyldihydropteridine diphosphokinase [Prevotella sp.]